MEDKKQTTQEEKEEKIELVAEEVAPTEEVAEEITEEVVVEEVRPAERINLRPGMTIRVYQKIKELNSKGEEKERVQYFEGMIIARKHGNEPGASITVRKISEGIGVEKVFPLFLPTITKIEVKRKARVRRAKLSFLKTGFKRKLKEKKLELVEVRG